jgi:thioredoxin reductase
MLPLVAEEHVDVITIGAGLSGIAAAWHLQDNREEKGGRLDLKLPKINLTPFSHICTMTATTALP